MHLVSCILDLGGRRGGWYHLPVTELRRILGYMRPYLGQMLAASVMLAVAGAMMSLVVATLEPMVNEVLLAKPVDADTPIRG